MKRDLLHFYTSFEGRATRYDFNVRTTLVLVLGSVIASCIDALVFAGDRNVFSGIWSYIAVALTIAVTARRLHDMNLSGWWQVPMQFLIFGGMIAIDTSGVQLKTAEDLIPLYERYNNVSNAEIILVMGGMLVVLVYFILLSAKQGTKGANKYGEEERHDAKK